MTHFHPFHTGHPPLWPQPGRIPPAQPADPAIHPQILAILEELRRQVEGLEKRMDALEAQAAAFRELS